LRSGQSAQHQLFGHGDDEHLGNLRRRKIDIIKQTDPNTYAASTNVNTADGARTGLFVSERDTLFVAVPHHGSQKAEVHAYSVE
jgi:hypothetical protein